MKIFVASLVLFTFAALASADKRARFEGAGFYDERHHEGVAQDRNDQGLLEDTSIANNPQKACNDKYTPCWNQASGDTCKQVACMDSLWKCLIGSLASAKSFADHVRVIT